MSARRPRLLLPACRLILRAACTLVARRERPEWLAEWRGELHYVAQRNLSPRACLAFAFGAIPDALCLRAHSARRAQRLESPVRCLSALAALAAAGIALALLLPAARRQILPPAWHGPGDLATLSPVPSVFGSDMEVTARQYLEWTEHSHPFLARAAFYQPNIARVRIGKQTRNWYIGRATQSLPALLRIRISAKLLAACAHNGVTPLILSRAAWLRDFAGAPAIIGRPIQISGRTAIIVAVARQGGSALPLPMDAFLLETPQAIQSIAAERYPWGYMLAQLSPSMNAPVEAGYPRILLTADYGDRSGLYAISFAITAACRRRIPLFGFLLALFITCLTLPLIVSIAIRSGLRTDCLSRRMRLKSWLFVSAKIALLLPTLYCLPVVISQSIPGISIDSGHALQVLATFLAARFAVSWIVRDQRQRCPHCLNKLECPARVGELSRSFLSFSGIEYVCAEGHGLLHVPDFPTSWYPSQRWLSLDQSWGVLFQHGR